MAPAKTKKKMATERLLDTFILLSRGCTNHYYSIYITFLVFVLITLSLVGGLVFQIVEAPPETKITEAIIRQRDSTLRQLRTKIQNGETKAEVTLFIQLYEGQYIGAIRNGTVIINGKEDPLWTFEGSVYYCVTTFSLVGYGNLAPKTNLGRAIAIIYCGFTVPVTSLILGEIGEMLLLAFDYIWVKLFSKDKRKKAAASNTQRNNNTNHNVYTDYQVNIKSPSQQGDTEIVCGNTDNKCVGCQKWESGITSLKCEDKKHYSTSGICQNGEHCNMHVLCQDGKCYNTHMLCQDGEYCNTHMLCQDGECYNTHMLCPDGECYNKHMLCQDGECYNTHMLCQDGEYCNTHMLCQDGECYNTHMLCQDGENYNTHMLCRNEDHCKMYVQCQDEEYCKSNEKCQDLEHYNTPVLCQNEEHYCICVFCEDVECALNHHPHKFVFCVNLTQNSDCVMDDIDLPFIVYERNGYTGMPTNDFNKHSNDFDMSTNDFNKHSNDFDMSTNYFEMPTNDFDKLANDDSDKHTNDGFVRPLSCNLHKSAYDDFDKSAEDDFYKSAEDDLDKSANDDFDKSAEDDFDKSADDDFDKSANDDKSVNDDCDKSVNDDFDKSAEDDFYKSAKDDLDKSVNDDFDKSAEDDFDKSADDDFDKSANDVFDKSANDDFDKSAEDDFGKSANDDKSVNDDCDKSVNDDFDKSAEDDYNKSAEDDFDTFANAYLKTLMASISVLSDSNINNLSDSSIYILSDSSIYNLSDSSIYNLSDSSINNLSDSSINNLSDSSINNLSDSSIYNLSDSSINNLPDSSINNLSDSSIFNLLDSSIFNLIDVKTEISKLLPRTDLLQKMRRKKSLDILNTVAIDPVQRFRHRTHHKLRLQSHFFLCEFMVRFKASYRYNKQYSFDADLWRLVSTSTNCHTYLPITTCIDLQSHLTCSRFNIFVCLVYQQELKFLPYMTGLILANLSAARSGRYNCIFMNGFCQYRLDSGIFVNGFSQYCLDSGIFMNGFCQYCLDSGIFMNGFSQYCLDSGIFVNGFSQYCLDSGIFMNGFSQYCLDSGIFMNGFCQYRLDSGIFVLVFDQIYSCIDASKNNDNIFSCNQPGHEICHLVLSFSKSYTQITTRLRTVFLYSTELLYSNIVFSASLLKGRDLKITDQQYQKSRNSFVGVPSLNTESVDMVSASYLMSGTDLRMSEIIISKEPIRKSPQSVIIRSFSKNDKYKCIEGNFPCNKQIPVSSPRQQTLLGSTSNTTRCLKHVQAKGRTVTQQKSCLDGIHCLISRLSMVFQRQVTVPDPLTLFWLSTPFRCVYIGKRIRDSLRMHLKNLTPENSTTLNSKPPKSKTLLTRSAQYGGRTRDRNNNLHPEVSDRDDDDDDDDELDSLHTIDFAQHVNKKASSEPVLLTIGTTFLFISLGSLFLTKATINMSYFDSFWFIFISVVTIGYGDVVPTDQILFAFFLSFIFIGLCLMSNLIGETSVFFSVNVTKTRAIAADAIAIVNTRKQLILVRRRSERANHHWSILRDRVLSKRIPHHLVEESVKYKMEIMQEERDLVRWAYKVYFKRGKQFVPETEIVTQPEIVEAPKIIEQPVVPETVEQQVKLSKLKIFKIACKRKYDTITKKNRHTSDQSIEHPMKSQQSVEEPAEISPEKSESAYGPLAKKEPALSVLTQTLKEHPIVDNSKPPEEPVPPNKPTKKSFFSIKK